MPPQDLGMLMQEHPIQLIKRVVRFVRVPALRHRRHRLPATLPRQSLKRPDRGRLSRRLAARPGPGLRQPAQLRQRRRIQNRARAHGVRWGRLGSEISEIPMSRPTRRSAGVPRLGETLLPPLGRGSTLEVGIWSRDALRGPQWDVRYGAGLVAANSSVRGPDGPVRAFLCLRPCSFRADFPGKKQLWESPALGH
jgi:hypothetical protein